jgi:hypothetical protein
VTPNVAASEGKKTDEGTIMRPPERKPNPMTVADPLGARTWTPATTKQASDIVTTAKSGFETAHGI